MASPITRASCASSSNGAQRAAVGTTAPWRAAKANSVVHANVHRSAACPLLRAWCSAASKAAKAASVAGRGGCPGRRRAIIACGHCARPPGGRHVFAKPRKRPRRGDVAHRLGRHPYHPPSNVRRVPVREGAKLRGARIESSASRKPCLRPPRRAPAALTVIRAGSVWRPYDRPGRVAGAPSPRLAAARCSPRLRAVADTLGRLPNRASVTKAGPSGRFLAGPGEANGELPAR